MPKHLVADLVHLYVLGRVRRGEVAEVTAANMRVTLTQFAEVVGRRDAARLSTRDVLRWMESIGHLAPGTRRNRFSVVRQFTRWMVESRYVRRDPCTPLKAPTVPRSVPRAQTSEAVRLTLTHCPDARARLIVTLMVQEGLRRVEVHRLELGDIDLAGNSMRVRGKGDHERILPVLAEVRAAMADYLAEHPATAGPLVRSYVRPTERLSPAEIGRVVTRAMRAAGVKRRALDGVSAHALRHTALTDMLRAGASPRDVQAVAGHRHLSATEVYLPLIVEPLERAMAGRSYR